MKCCEARAYLEAYADAELSTERCLDVEAHLSDCPCCQAELEMHHNVTCLVRSACKGDQPSASFEDRLQKCLREESSRQDRAALPLPWSTITPLAAAAAAAFWFSYSNHQPLARGSDLVSAVSSPDELVEALVLHHSAPKSPEFTDTAAVKQLEPELGLAIHAPNLDRYGAHFEGGGIFNVDSANAASLYYSVAGHRVTVYVYDPEALPLRMTRELHPRVVRDRAVFVGKRRGYSIAACERQGVGYAIAGDLSDDESAELVAALDN